MLDANRLEDGPHRAAHRHLCGVPLAGISTHADDDEDRNLERDQQRRQRVDRIAEATGLEHDGRPHATDIETRRDAERFLFTRRERGPDVRVVVAEYTQYV